MRNKIIISLAIFGVILGLVSAYIFNSQKKAQAPLFKPASNPYQKGIYAEGIVESYQKSGENININPEVPGVISEISVAEGATVQKGQILMKIDDSVQRALVEQQKAQAEAALALLQELKAEPRKETLQVSVAQMDAAKAGLKNAQDQYDKLLKSYKLDSRSVSKNDLDNAENALKLAQMNFKVAQRQYELTKAGAWVYDVRNQEDQYLALTKAYNSGAALLAKYIIKAPADGVVLSLNAAIGSFVSNQGTYDSYTEGYSPTVVMGSPQQDYLEVRAYIDDILVHRLPDPSQMHAKLFLRGSDISMPLEFVRIQPYVSPKIELSNQRAEKVDIRVLPVIFRVKKSPTTQIFPGQLVDVYVSAK